MRSTESNVTGILQKWKVDQYGWNTMKAIEIGVRREKVPSNLIIQYVITVLADESYDKSAGEEIV